MHDTRLGSYGSYQYGNKRMYANLIHGAYMSGVTYCALSYAVLYTLVSFVFAKFLHRHKAWTVIYSKFKIFGIIGKKQ